MNASGSRSPFLPYRPLATTSPSGSGSGGTR